MSANVQLRLRRLERFLRTLRAGLADDVLLVRDLGTGRIWKAADLPLPPAEPEAPAAPAFSLPKPSGLPAKPAVAMPKAKPAALVPPAAVPTAAPAPAAATAPEAPIHEPPAVAELTEPVEAAADTIAAPEERAPAEVVGSAEPAVAAPEEAAPEEAAPEEAAPDLVTQTTAALDLLQVIMAQAEAEAAQEAAAAPAPEEEVAPGVEPEVSKPEPEEEDLPPVVVVEPALAEPEPAAVERPEEAAAGAAELPPPSTDGFRAAEVPWSGAPAGEQEPEVADEEEPAAVVQPGWDAYADRPAGSFFAALAWAPGQAFGLEAPAGLGMRMAEPAGTATVAGRRPEPTAAPAAQRRDAPVAQISVSGSAGIFFARIPWGGGGPPTGPGSPNGGGDGTPESAIHIEFRDPAGAAGRRNPESGGVNPLLAGFRSAMATADRMAAGAGQPAVPPAGPWSRS